jgi:hypothetical protein
VVIPTAAPTTILFHAIESWSPGGNTVTFHWDFGDGALEQNSGTNARFVAQHTYASGQYLACLTVIDEQGRSAQACWPVQPGLIILDHLSDKRPWEFCQSNPSVTFLVTSSGAPLERTHVEIAGDGWQVSRASDANGLMQILLDPTKIRANGLPLSKPSRFHIGAVRVTASKPGYQPRQSVLWMVDCEGVLDAVERARRYREYVLDRLAGYAALRDLRRQGVDDIIGDLLNLSRSGDDPRRLEGFQIGCAADILLRLESSISTGGDILPITKLLGIDPNRDDTLQLMDERFHELWDLVDQAGARFESRYGVPG